MIVGKQIESRNRGSQEHNPNPVSSCPMACSACIFVPLPIPLEARSRQMSERLKEQLAWLHEGQADVGRGAAECMRLRRLSCS